MPTPAGAVFTKGGEQKFFYPEEWERAAAEGWTPPDTKVVEQRVGATPSAVDVADVIKRAPHGAAGSIADIQEQQRNYVAGEDERVYGSGMDEIASLGLGVARGLSLGTSDWLARAAGVEKDTLEGYQRVNPVLSTGGELAAVLAASLIPGGQGTAAQTLAKLLPAARASAATARMGKAIGGVGGRIAAETLEGYIYGFGHGIGQLALKDEPLAAEALWQELGVNPIYGGLVGGTVSAGLAGGQKLFQYGASKFAKRGAAVADVLDISTPEGAQFAGSVASRLDDYQRTASELAQEVRGSVGLSKYEMDAMVKKGQRLEQFDTEVHKHLADVEDQLKTWEKGAGQYDADRTGWLKRRDEIFNTTGLQLKRVKSGTTARPLKAGEELLPELRGKADPFSEEKLLRSSMRILDEEDAAVRGLLPSMGGDPKLVQRINKARAEAVEALKGGDPSTRLAAIKKYRRAVETAADSVGLGTGSGRMDFDAMAQTGEAGAILSSQPSRAYQFLDAYEELLQRDITEAALRAAPNPNASLLEKGKAHLEQARMLSEQVRRARKAIKENGGFKRIFADAPLGDGLNESRKMAMNTYVEALEALGKHVGKPVDELADMVRGPVSLGGVLDRAATRLEGDQLAVSGVEKGLNDFRGVFGVGKDGKVGAEGVAAFMQQSPQQLAESIDKLNKQFDKLDTLSAAMNRGDLTENARMALKDMGEQVLKTVDPEGALKGLQLQEMFAMAGLTFVPDIEGPYDDLVKAALGMHLLKKAGAGDLVKGRKGVRLLRAASQRALARTGATAAGNLARAGGAGPLASAAASGMVASTGFHVGGKLYDMMAPVTAAAQATGGVTSALARVVGSLYQKGARGISVPAFSATAVLAVNDFGADTKPKKRDLRALYEHRRDQILKLASDPLALQYQIAENIQAVMKGHLGLADKMIVNGVNVAMFLAGKIPRDPGVMHRVGKSRWQPSDRDIRTFARYVSGATNPMATMMRLANGTITPQEAEAVRTLWPATFQKWQQMVVENLPAIQENATREQCINMSILTGVPVDSTMRPGFGKFVQQVYVNRGLTNQAPQSQGKLKPGVLKPEPRTHAQSLASR